MKLKNIIYSVSLCAAALIPVACDDVAEDDRFIYVEPAEVSKCVLLEDFTGQGCVNCPAAAELIELMQETYGAENIIAVGIYGGDKGTTARDGSLYPLYTEDGGWYYDHWGVTSQPRGLVDRRGGLLGTSSWPGAVYTSIQRQDSVQLEAVCSYDESSRKVDISISAANIATQKGVTGNLQVWLVEDSVVSVQWLTGNVENEDYVHNHVFRATVNDRMGDPISLTAGGAETRDFSYVLDEDWNEKYMSVVAFVYNDADGVLQAVRKSIINIPDDGTNDDNSAEKGA